MKILLENIKNFGYKVPKDPELLLYDFYFIVGYLLGDRKDDPLLDFVFKEATKDCVENLRKHMLKALKWSLSAEFRNIFSNAYLKIDKMEGDLKVFLKEYRGAFSKYSDEVLQDFTPDRLDTKYQQNQDTFGDKSLFDQDEHSYKELGGRNDTYADSFFALQKVQKIQGLSEEDMAKWFIRCFDPDSDSIRWKSSYGGRAWQTIAKAYLSLLLADTMAKKIAYIDHAYDLQHNTGSVFTKVQAYTSSEKDYQWLNNALEWKKHQTDLRGFYDKVSGSLQPVVAWVAKNERKAGTMEDFGKPPKISKAKKSDLPSSGAKLTLSEQSPLAVKLTSKKEVGTFLGLLEKNFPMVHWQSGDEPLALLNNYRFRGTTYLKINNDAITFMTKEYLGDLSLWSLKLFTEAFTVAESSPKKASPKEGLPPNLPLAIKIANMRELGEVLKFIERKYPGVHWNSGADPTQYEPFVPTNLYIYRRGNMAAGKEEKKEKDFKKMSAVEFLSAASVVSPEAKLPSKVKASGGIKVGDTVTVINNQYVYSSYGKWAEKYGLSNFIPSEMPENGQRVKVIVIGLHSIGDPDNILLGVETLDSDKIQYIISDYGVKKVVQ